MRDRGLLRNLRIIAVVALAPTLVLAMESTFVHATVLDPSLKCSSCYLNAIGGLFPWFVTEIPAQLHNVSLLDRLYLPNLSKLYVICLSLVAMIWITLRTLWLVAASLAAPHNTR